MRLLGGGFRLLIAGTGEAEYESDLKQKAAGLPVEFAGFVRLPEFLEHTDMVILPSWEEPFGIVLLEAMATGIPVIATGPAEVVSGVRIPPHNPGALADAIRTLRPDETIARAREHVEKNFDIRKVTPRIEEFYSRVSG